MRLRRLMIEMQINDQTLIAHLLVFQNGVGHISGEFTVEAHLSGFPALIEPHKPRVNHEEFVCEVQQADLFVVVEVSGNADVAVVLTEGLLDVGSLVGFSLLQADYTGELPQQFFA